MALNAQQKIECFKQTIEIAKAAGSGNGANVIYTGSMMAGLLEETYDKLVELLEKATQP